MKNTEKTSVKKESDKNQSLLLNEIAKTVNSAWVSKMSENIINYSESSDIFADSCQIIDGAKSYAYRQVNTAMVVRNWLLGRSMAEEELKGKDRADYGLEVIKFLSKKLTDKYGKGFTKTNLYHFLDFYNSFPNIFHSVRGKSEDNAIFHSVRGESPILSWTHYRALLKVDNADARNWYMKETSEQAWSARTLDRNISTQYYFRLLASQNKEPVTREMKEKTKEFQEDKLEFIKNPVVAEFLGLSPNRNFSESNLESAIIDNLQKFIMEMGKGYAFVARQQHIQTADNDYFIDLVFYNYIIKSFVLIDLKVNKITYQDVGQMDMYLQMYDKHKKCDDDNPTIGIILCADTDQDVAEYSTLAKNDQMFAAKYIPYLPTKEELKREIDRQKLFFKLQQES